MESNLKLGLFVFLLFGLFTNPILGQKIKIKKEVVYVDKQPAFQFVKLQGSLLKPYFWAILTMKGDTVVRFNSKAIHLPEFPQESDSPSKYYYEVEFEGVGEKTIMKYAIAPFRKTLAQQLLQTEVLTRDGKVNTQNVSKFVSANEEERLAVEVFNKRMAERTEIVNDEARIASMQNLTKRDAESDLFLDGNKIRIGTAEVGFIREDSNNSYGRLYVVISRGTKKKVASIFYEKEKKRTYIRTMSDDGKHEFFFSKDQPESNSESKPDAKGFIGRMNAALTEEAERNSWYRKSIEFLLDKGYL